MVPNYGPVFMRISLMVVYCFFLREPKLSSPFPFGIFKLRSPDGVLFRLDPYLGDLLPPRDRLNFFFFARNLLSFCDFPQTGALKVVGPSCTFQIPRFSSVRLPHYASPRLHPAPYFFRSPLEAPLLPADLFFLAGRAFV